MIDWRAGYSSTWRVFKVNRDTWADGEPLDGIVSATYETTMDEDAPILGRGSLTSVVPVGGEFEEGYYRIVMTAQQNGVLERVNVCTMECSTVDGDIDHNSDERNIQGRSVLYPASVTILADGSYAPQGADGAQWCGSVLHGCINAPIVVNGGFTLDEHLVFDPGTYVLEAVWKVLDAGNHVIRIDGDGTVRIVPKPTEPSVQLDATHARLIHTGVHYALDYSEVPNRYRAIESDNEATAINNDPLSMTSVVRRGWTHDIRDESPVRVNGETLAAYAARRLEEESTVYDSRTYSREWWPDVCPHDLVRGSLASVRLDGDLRVVRQSFKCEVGIVVEEESRMEVKTWQRT